MDLHIYISGDMAFLEAILTGLGHVFNKQSSSIFTAFKIALLLNALACILKYIMDQKSGLLTNFWVSLFVYLAFFSPTATPILEKHGEAPRVIAGQVPIGILAPASYVSLMGQELANIFRDNVVATNFGFGNAESQKLLITEYGLDPLNALLKMRQAREDDSFLRNGDLPTSDDPGATSSNLHVAIGAYFADCVLRYNRLAAINGQPKMELGRGSNALDAWSTYAVHTPWSIQLTLNGAVGNYSCDSAHAAIQTVLRERAEEIAETQLASTLAERDSDSTLADRKEKVLEFMHDMGDMGVAGSARLGQLQENAFVETLIKGNCSQSVLPSVEEMQMCSAQLDQVTSRRNIEASKSAGFKEMMLPMVTFMEGFVYLVSPFIIFVILLLGVKGLSMAAKYFTALVWVVLMPVCQVAVDVYLSVYFNRFLARLANSETGYNLVSVSSQTSAWTDLESFIAFAGTAQAMVPTLAMFILFAGVHTLMGMAGAAGSAGASQAHMGGNVSASGQNGVHTKGLNTATLTGSGGGVVLSSTNQVADANANFGTMKADMSTSQSIADVAAQQRVTSAAENVSRAETHAYQEVQGQSSGHVINQMRSLGYTENDANAYAFASAMKMDKATADEFVKNFGKNLSFGADGSVNISGDVGKLSAAAATLGMGGFGSILQHVGKIAGDKGPISADVKVGAGGKVEYRNADSESSSWKEMEGISESTSNSIQNTVSALKSVSTGVTDQDSYTDQVSKSEAIQEHKQAVETHQEALSRQQKIQNAGQQGVSFSNQIDSSVRAASMNGYDSAKILDQSNFDNRANAYVGSILSEDQRSEVFGDGGIDVANMSSEQLQKLHDTLSESQVAELEQAGIFKSVDNPADGTTSLKQSSKAETISALTGKQLTEDDLDSLLREPVVGTVSPLDHQKMRSDRGQLLMDTFNGMTKQANNAGLYGENGTAGLQGASAFFKSAGEKSLENGGQQSELASFGNALNQLTYEDVDSAYKPRSIEEIGDDPQNEFERMRLRAQNDVAFGDQSVAKKAEENMAQGVVSRERMDAQRAEVDKLLSDVPKADQLSTLTSKLREAMQDPEGNDPKGRYEDKEAYMAALAERIEDGVRDGGKAIRTDIDKALPFGAANSMIGDWLDHSHSNRDQVELMGKQAVGEALEAITKVSDFNDFINGELTGIANDEGISSDRAIRQEVAANAHDYIVNGNDEHKNSLIESLGQERFDELERLGHEALNASDALEQNQQSKQLASLLMGSTQGGDTKLLSQIQSEFAANGDLSDDSKYEIRDRLQSERDKAFMAYSHDGEFFKALDGITNSFSEMPTIVAGFGTEREKWDLSPQAEGQVNDYIRGSSDDLSMLSEDQARTVQQYRRDMEMFESVDASGPDGRDVMVYNDPDRNTQVLYSRSSNGTQATVVGGGLSSPVTYDMKDRMVDQALKSNELTDQYIADVYEKGSSNALDALPASEQQFIKTYSGVNVDTKVHKVNPLY